MSELYQNFYIKAPKEMLNVPLPLSMFKKENDIYMTIGEELEKDVWKNKGVNDGN